jgi:Tfp pilus assembly protein PilF
MSDHILECRPTIEQVRNLIEQNQAAQALDLLDRCGERSDALENARGVCLLRLKQTDEAARVFGRLVFPDNNCHSPSPAPLRFQVNLASALLASNQVVASQYVLDRIQDRRNDTLRQLRQSLRQWKKGLSLSQRLMFFLGIQPGKKIRLEYLLGEL